MSLPTAFCARMRALLGDEQAPVFLESFWAPRAHGLRVNPRYPAGKDHPAHRYFTLTPVPWCAEGFYYPADERPGKHPLYEAGAYYIQEPSAMAVGALAAPGPDEWVLDLCAAPGGKTTHLAPHAGFVLANEIHPARAKTLAQSVERMGLTNTVVTNETPARLAARFPEAFDCVVVDAPCSGEGMFRKDEDAASEWNEDSPALCAARQDEILDEAVRMLRPGGRLIYSTCTFAPEENEGTLTRLLARHPDFTVQAVEGYPWFAPGEPAWYPGADERVRHAFRLWPHKLRGEGHFCAVLTRAGDAPRRMPPAVQPLTRLPDELTAFWRDTMALPLDGLRFTQAGDRLWLSAQPLPDTAGLKTLRTGVEVGTLKKGRLEPAHALAHAYAPEEFVRRLELAAGSPEAERYLKGETLPCSTENGWTAVCVDGCVLGWGKAVGGVLKNHYPKGLRWK